MNNEKCKGCGREVDSVTSTDGFCMQCWVALNWKSQMYSKMFWEVLKELKKRGIKKIDLEKLTDDKKQVEEECQC